jgi:hypothetical protein
MLAQQHGVVIFTNIAFHINMSSSSALALIAQPHLPALFSANELYMRPPLYLQPPIVKLPLVILTTETADMIFTIGVAVCGIAILWAIF